MWYEFDSLEAFNSWHDAICASLGIPDESTYAYTTAFEVEGKWIAVVEDQYSDGLDLTELRLPPTERS